MADCGKENGAVGLRQERKFGQHWNGEETFSPGLRNAAEGRVKGWKHRLGLRLQGFCTFA